MAGRRGKPAEKSGMSAGGKRSKQHKGAVEKSTSALKPRKSAAGRKSFRKPRYGCFRLSFGESELQELVLTKAQSCLLLAATKI